MDLSKFKKIATDDKTTTLAHKDGHVLKVAHAKLAPKLKKDLEKLPMHLAQGTVEPIGYETKPEDELPTTQPQVPWASNVPPVPEQEKPSIGKGLTDQMKLYNSSIDLQYMGKSPIDFPPEKAESMKFHDDGKEPENLDYQTLAAVNKGLKSQKQSEQNKQDWQALETQKANQQRQEFGLKPLPGPSGLGSDRAQPISDGNTQVSPPQNQGQSNPMAKMDMSGDQMDALALGKQGIDSQQQAETQFGQMQQAAAKAQEAALKHIDTQYQAGLNNKTAEIDSVLKDIQDHQIDPKHYMESPDAPGRVQTAIGLILGGIGGGLMHQENPALKYLNAQIDRDIQSQQNNAQNKLSIAGHYSQELGNMQAGAAFARATQMALYASKINEAAGKTADPMAKARAQQASAQLIQQAIPYLHQSQAYSMLYGKEGSNLSPEQKLLMMKNAGMINDKQYEEGNKELSKVGEVNDLKRAYESSYNDLNSKFMAGTFSPKDRASAKDAIAGRIMRLGEGRVNPEMADKQADAILPTGFESGSTTTNKLQRGHALFDSMVQAPTLTGIGLGPAKIKPINKSQGFK